MNFLTTWQEPHRVSGVLLLSPSLLAGVIAAYAVPALALVSSYGTDSQPCHDGGPHDLGAHHAAQSEPTHQPLTVQRATAVPSCASCFHTSSAP